MQLEEARARSARHAALAKELQESRDRAAATKDGVPVMLRANVELPAEAILARDQGAEGIGLFRTEFLYIDRHAPPNNAHTLGAERGPLPLGVVHRAR